MTLTAGTKLGSYEITGAIGAGGMGEVYRAHDPKLGRDVAIKVLPEAFAGDSARMARFQREAKVLASLSPPFDGRQDSKRRLTDFGVPPAGLPEQVRTGIWSERS